jgi:hypothetical protein
MPDAEKDGADASTVKAPEAEGVLASLPSLKAIARSGNPVLDTVTAPVYSAESDVGADPSLV